MVENVLLSICIPTYNRPEYLSRLLKTIKSERKELFEVVVSDSSENDASREIVHQMLNRQQFLWKYHKNNVVISATENMNMCIRLALGKFIYLIHDDDFMEENGVDIILDKIALNSRYKTFMFGVKLVDSKGSVMRKQVFKQHKMLSPREAYKRLLNNSSFIRFPSMVVAKDAYRSAGDFNPKYPDVDDTDMWIRLLCKHGLFCIPEIVSCYTIHEKAATAKMFRKKILLNLLELFDKAGKKKLLPEGELEKYKSNFFHQFILAGTYRAIKSGNYDEGRKVFSLFSLPDIKSIPVSLKWYPVKIALFLILGLERTRYRLFTKTNIIDYGTNIKEP